MEAPPDLSPGSDTTTVTIDIDLVTMRVQASFSALLGNVAAAQVHCRSSPDGNVGVASQTPGFTGSPLGGTSGSCDHIFDATLASICNAAFITTSGGTVGSALNALVAGLDAG